MTDYFWKIEMSVGGGHYMELNGIFSTKANAERAFPSASKDSCRTVLYKTGRGTSGPERAP